MTDEEWIVAQVVADADRVEAAVQAAVRDALIVHKKLGHPVADWRDGKVVWIPAEDIVIPPEIIVPEFGGDDPSSREARERGISLS